MTFDRRCPITSPQPITLPTSCLAATQRGARSRGRRTIARAVGTAAKRGWFVIVLMIGAVTANAAERKVTGDGKTALDRYVAKADDSYRWVKKDTGKIIGVEYAELILTSQTWRDIRWRHQLFVIKPSSTKPGTKHGLLFIAGGRWKDKLADPANKTRLPNEAAIFAAIAERMKTPVAVLLHVPQQPIFDGKVEDAIIALTFEKYLKTGDEEWPLLLPMVKSAVRAMDAMQEFAKDEWSLGLETFTVTGASKRGWTIWLTGAADKRVTAIAPMVIDMLNMQRHLEHQKTVWGDYSLKINDYTERGIQKHLATDSGKALRAIVDPFSYRQRITQPKLLIIGTNDHYWPLDALNLYWDNLVGPKYVLYVPNNRHGLRDYGRVLGTLNALHQQAVNGSRMPKLSWNYQPNGKDFVLNVKSDVRPTRVNIWQATAEKRDFRKSKWSSQKIERKDNGYTFELPQPKTGYAALFGEAVYETDGVPYYLSTNVRVIKSTDSTKDGE